MSSSGKIQIDQLTGSENYIDWALRIKAVLVKDDLLEPIIDEKPQNNSKNLKALAIFQLFCAKGPLLYIKACTTAYKAWITLEELSRIVDRYRNRKYVEYLQFFLHDWGKQKLNSLFF